jgi:threonine aldolase
MRAFASDNYAGAHPEVLAAVADANAGHAVSYGDDPWTARSNAVLREHFGADADPWLVFNGTAANVLALGALCRTWEAVITPATSHLHVDEAGAPERLAGVKLLTVPTPDGKLRPDDVLRGLDRVGDEHAIQPRVVSIANTTELGTVYTPDEVRALAETAHANGLFLHVDGARLANAAVALGASLRDITTDAGVDVTSFGATKLGALGVEALVFLRPLDPAMKWRRKQHAQLASKMRFLSAQVVALLDGDLWQRCAAQANAMAQRLADGVDGIPGATLSRRPEANALFAIVQPPEAVEALRERFPFYTWDEVTGEVRWMCAWDTTEADVDAFVAALDEVTGGRTAAAAARP